MRIWSLLIDDKRKKKQKNIEDNFSSKGYHPIIWFILKPIKKNLLHLDWRFAWQSEFNDGFRLKIDEKLRHLDS